MGYGSFAGGLADGINNGMRLAVMKQDMDFKSKEIEFKDKDMAFKDKERGRQEKSWGKEDLERKQYEDIIKSTHAEFKDGLKDAGGNTVPDGGIVNNQAAVAQPAPTSTSAIVAQGIGGSTATQQPSARPMPIAAQGIQLPAVEPKNTQQVGAKEPNYREPNINDKFNYSDKLFSRLMEAGLFDKAREAAQFRAGLLTEKLQLETKDREDAVRGGIAAIKSKNPSSILAALQGISQFIPDGNDVTDVKPTSDGKYQVTYGKNPPVVMDEEQLTSTVLGAGKVESVLAYDDGLQKARYQKLKDERDAKLQENKFAQDKKNQNAQIAVKREEIAAGVLKGGEATSEIKNVRFLLQNGLAKNAGDAWKMARSGVTPSGERIISDGAGGVIIVDQDAGDIETISRRGEQRFIRQKSSPQASTQTPPPADTHARFSSDPAMKGHQLGKATAQGVEVLDANGKLMGYYN